jgi:alpha-beta hydrolase superfamily lysophospholipase
MLSTGYYIEQTNKSKLFFRYWHAENTKLCICLVHGLGEHSGRYEEWASYFVNNGIAVCAIDLKGHGNSEGKRGHGTFKHFYTNINLLLNEAGKHYPNIPIILYGHGLGGSIVINYYISCKPKINGLIITSPWFNLPLPASVYKIALARFIRFFLPFIAFENGLNLADISRDAKVVNDYKNDVLVHKKISLKLYFDAVKHGKNVIGQGYMVQVPLLLMHGSADNITSCKSTTLFTRNTGMFTRFKIWEDCLHELHHEPNKIEIFNYVMDWVKEHFKHE